MTRLTAGRNALLRRRIRSGLAMTCTDETTRGTEVSTAELRHAMGHFATGVTVITSVGADGGRLRLVLGRVLFGVGLEDRPFRLAGGRRRHRLHGLGTAEQPGDQSCSYRPVGVILSSPGSGLGRYV
jgi:hypothetical protein